VAACSVERTIRMPAMSAWAAGADMPTMIDAGQHLATRSKKRQSARVPRDQTLPAALHPICPLIDPLVWGIAWSTSCAGSGRRAGSRRSASRWLRLLITARRPGYRYPSAERVQKPLRESPLEVAGFRACHFPKSASAVGIEMSRDTLPHSTAIPPKVMCNSRHFAKGECNPAQAESRAWSTYRWFPKRPGTRHGAGPR
jgi:hypothetical protein